METHNWITIFLASMRLGDTPVPIPNTTVKTQSADGTALETVWESRWLPAPNLISLILLIRMYLENFIQKEIEILLISH